MASLLLCCNRYQTCTGQRQTPSHHRGLSQMVVKEVQAEEGESSKATFKPKLSDQEGLMSVG